MFYFAYGSNLDQQQMKKRCPESIFIKPCLLENYQLAFCGENKIWKGAVATIVDSPGNTVWGALYQITEKDLGQLDFYEEYPHKYARKTVSVYDTKNNPEEAFIYFMNVETENLPSQKYKDAIIAGAISCSLSKEYLLLLEKIKTTTP